MSDERPEMTPQELDELASAYLDGEATAEEAALVESDPGMQALVQEHRAIRDLVATPVEQPSDEVRDEMIAQALAHRAPVVSMEKARRRLRSIPPQARVILAAAAVVAAIAMVGVTVFERAFDDDAGDQVSVDSASAPADAEEPEMSMDDSAPASAPEPESDEPPEEPAEDMAMELAGPMSDDADSAEEALPEPIDLTRPEEESAPVAASPESPEEEPADEAPSDDSADAEPTMADEPEDLLPASGETPLLFDTEADLVAHVVLLADELTDAQGTVRTDDASAIDLMDCPLFPDEAIELLTRFEAMVEGAEAQVSVYLGEDDLRFTQTTPPPQCELFNSHTFTNWP